MDGCLVCRPDSHPYGVKKYRCRTDTVSSPDDGHISIQFSANKKKLKLVAVLKMTPRDTANILFCYHV